MITLSTKKIIKLLIIILILLTVLDLIFSYINHFYYDIPSINCLYKLFNSNFESNIPTYFSVFLILFNVIILAAIGLCDKKRYGFWYFFSGLFFIASVDELAQIHENVDVLIRKNAVFDSLFKYGWVSLWLIFVLVILTVISRFIASLPKTTRNLFIIAGTVYVIGALAFEVIGGQCLNNGTCYLVCTKIEEFLEMSGMIIFAYTFLNYLSHLKPKLEIKLTEQ